ncbi:MAG: hypothetical protein Q4G36_06415 [Paracoccus sp. (in: a-proteobacteria)]|nr:hypothetical protein [Paracoccus sp. (in: a-proteobacteria)]
MRKIVWICLAGGLAVTTAAALDLSAEPAPPPTGAAATLMQGCSDVPEAVALVSELRQREQRINHYLAAVDRREGDLRDAEARIRARLDELRGMRDVERRARIAAQDEVEADIAQLVSVYDAMRPRDAAAIISDLPADFAAELLMRLNPDSSARIIASVQPRQAAILTTYMGARRAHQR